MWTIARKNNISVDELKKINNLTGNLLSIGQVLVITENTAIPEPTIPIDSLDTYYTVKSGDTLYSIARKNNLSVNELKALNSLTSNTLSIGQKLLISTSNSTPTTGKTTYTVKPGDTLYKVASTYKTSIADLKLVNNLTSDILSIGQILIIPSSAQEEFSTYTVKPGDTLYAIAQSFGTTVDNLKLLNNITNNTLSIGQKLLLP